MRTEVLQVLESKLLRRRGLSTNWFVVLTTTTPQRLRLEMAPTQPLRRIAA